MEAFSVLAGAATSDIIEQYVSTIKTLREVDPTGDLPPHILCKSATQFIYTDSHTDHHLKGFASARELHQLHAVFTVAVLSEAGIRDLLLM